MDISEFAIDLNLAETGVRFPLDADGNCGLIVRSIESEYYAREVMQAIGVYSDMGGQGIKESPEASDAFEKARGRALIAGSWGIEFDSMGFPGVENITDEIKEKIFTDRKLIKIKKIVLSCAQKTSSFQRRNEETIKKKLENTMIGTAHGANISQISN